MKAPSTLVLLTCLCSISAIVSAQAKSISPKPEAGLWRSEATTLINGEDAQAAMRKAYQDMVNQFPPEQREQMAEMLGVQDIDAQMKCISAEEAAAMTDPETLLAEAKEEMGDCDITVEQAGASKLTFKGRCEGTEGFNGDMQGEMEMISSREMRSKFSGEGLYEMDAGAMTATTAGSAGSPVNIQHTEVSTWVSANCGTVTNER